MRELVEQFRRMPPLKEPYLGRLREELRLVEKNGLMPMFLRVRRGRCCEAVQDR